MQNKLNITQPLSSDGSLKLKEVGAAQVVYKNIKNIHNVIILLVRHVSGYFGLMGWLVKLAFTRPISVLCIS